MQAGALAEFRADWSTAVKTYQTAYSQVQKVPLGTVLPLQHWYELTSVAEQMHIKVGCYPDCGAATLDCMQTPIKSRRRPWYATMSLRPFWATYCPEVGHCMGFSCLRCCPMLLGQNVGSAQATKMVIGASCFTFAQ